MGRAPCCDKGKVKKGPWSPEEDTKLKSYIQLHGTGGNWIALPHKIGLKRCGKSCRLRWLNYLRPNIKHGGFTEDEDNLICTLYTSIGSRWSVIASQLPGRTDNDIKNYWNTRLKKKLLAHHHPMPPAYNNNNVLIHEQLQAKSSISSFENKYNDIPAGFGGTILEEYSNMPAGGGADFLSSSDLPENAIWGPSTTVCGPNIPQDWTLLFDEPSLLNHQHNNTFFSPLY